MLNKKIILVAFLTLVLTGCGNKGKEYYLVKNPSRLKTKIDDCRTLGRQAMHNPDCLFALDVFNQAVRLSREMMASPPRFGKKIIKMQIRLAQLNEQIAKHKTKTLIRQRDQLKFQLNIMLALIAEAQNM